ncbi:hypothetical protein AA0117_g13277 [Alternaria alternata]|uniref:Uncharacterized protein n=1 Tax=Alternaria alternata TaxID=5599 RepID=A0A4Q4MQE4_ALTAL|nr:hypothetical protein AA0117_g13277 [Alternaria alternata]
MNYTKVIGKPHEVARYSLVEVDSRTGMSDESHCYKTSFEEPFDEPNMEYLRRPGKLGPVPDIMGESLHAVTHSKNDMEKIFKDERARKFAFRIHDAGDHLFLVVDHGSSPVLRRVAFDDSINLELEKTMPAPGSQAASKEYSNLLQESIRRKELYGWIVGDDDLNFRCHGFVKPYMLVPCLAGNTMEWVETQLDIGKPVCEPSIIMH